MNRRRAAAVGALVILISLWLTGQLFTYGAFGSPNGGLVLQLPAQHCVGVELWGHPGVFGGSYSDCDF